MEQGLKYDWLIVGSGMFGAVFAHEMQIRHQSVLVIDQRGHIGGNCYTEAIDGINVHKYGPHCFHSGNEFVWNYIRQFAKFNNFINRPKAIYKKRLYSLPVNLMTFYQIAGCITPGDAHRYLEENRVKCDNPSNAEEWLLDKVGPLIYETLFKGYSKKQWMRDVKDLPVRVVARLPIRFNYDDNYYSHPYQGIPVGGYTGIFNNLLDGVRVELGVSFSSILNWRKYAKRILFTGRIDEFFGHCFGELEYRTLRFEDEHHVGDYQGNAQINYTEENIPWTRITEHKHFEFGSQPKTIITKEYPIEWTEGSTPYYPIDNDKNRSIHEKYVTLAENCLDTFGGGRLWDHKYYDMDQVVGSALNKVKQLEN